MRYKVRARLEIVAEFTVTADCEEDAMEAIETRDEDDFMSKPKDVKIEILTCDEMGSAT